MGSRFARAAGSAFADPFHAVFLKAAASRPLGTTRRTIRSGAAAAAPLHAVPFWLQWALAFARATGSAFADPFHALFLKAAASRPLGTTTSTIGERGGCGRPAPWSEPSARRRRSTTMIHRRSLVLLVALASASAVVLFGRDGAETTPRSNVTAPEPVAALVEAFAAGDSRAVVARLERRVERAPHDADDLAQLGLGYLQLGRETGEPSWLPRAGEALRRSLEDGERRGLALTGLAQLAIAQHRFRAAIPPAREALRRDPENVAALGALADALVETGRYREAFRVLDRMAAVGPSVAAYARVAFARELLGRHEAAAEAMRLALEAGTGIAEQEAWTWTQLGSLALRAGQTDRAANAFEHALEAAPGYVHADVGLARVAVARDRLDDAAARLERVVERLPAPQYAILLGDVYERLGSSARAREAYRLVDTIDALRTAGGIRTDLQLASYRLDREIGVPEALERARAAYRAAPSVRAADVVAWGLYRAGRCGAARRWSVEALRLGTRDGSMLFHRGLIERCLDAPDAGAAWFRRALAADPLFSVRFAPVAERLAA